MHAYGKEIYVTFYQKSLNKSCKLRYVIGYRRKDSVFPDKTYRKRLFMAEYCLIACSFVPKAKDFL